MPQLVKQLERQLSVIARNLREPVVLANGAIVQRSTASLLYLLAEHEPVRLGVVATLLNVDPSTTTRQVQYASALGLLERSEDPDDRRANLIRLSPAGRDLYESMVYQQRQGLLRILEGWPDADREALVRLLSLFNNEVDQLRDEAALARRHPPASPQTG